MQHWVNMPEKFSVEEAGVKVELTTCPHQLLCKLSESADLLPFCIPSIGLFLIMKQERRVRPLLLLALSHFFVVPGRRFGKSCRILLTEDVANRSFQGFVWSFPSFPSHQFWEVTVNFPCWQMPEQEQGASVSYHTGFIQRQVLKQTRWDIFFFVLLIFVDICKSSNR